ncbi:hypothetical protein Tco_0516740, partial [Tanacetum coccineum]
SGSALVPSEVVHSEVSPSAHQLRARMWFIFDYFGAPMLLTPNLNHPSIVQLSPEYCSGIGCLYHKYLQRSKLIVTASFGWSRGLLEKSALDVCFREYVDTASFSFKGSKLVRGASSSHGCSISLEILPYQRLFHHPLVEIISLNFPVFCFGRSYLYYPAPLLPLVISFAASVHPG